MGLAGFSRKLFNEMFKTIWERVGDLIRIEAPLYLIMPDLQQLDEEEPTENLRALLHSHAESIPKEGELRYMWGKMCEKAFDRSLLQIDSVIPIYNYYARKRKEAQDVVLLCLCARRYDSHCTFSSHDIPRDLFKCFIRTYVWNKRGCF